MNSARVFLDDNVRVFCRFRPLSTMEQEFPLCVSFDAPRHVICKMPQTPMSAIQQTPCSSGALNTDGGLTNVVSETVDQLRYTFSRVYGPEVTQEQLYQDVASPIVDDVMQGYNGTLLVYGQTGSGKTHTMLGLHGVNSETSSFSSFITNKNATAGIVPRAVRQVFSAISAAEKTAEFEVRAQFVEVYMEHIRDLLNPSGGNLSLREDASGFYIEDCDMPYVSNTKELLDLLRCAMQRRVTAMTAKNKLSSRSHCVVGITVKKIDSTSHESIIGKLFLVDLAGSEKVSKTLADGLRLAEARLINKSLATLGHVIMCLTERQTYIPYRNSKLTQILKDSLGGNSRTALIVCCSMSQLNSHETVSSIRFGARAQKVRNRAVVNRQFTLRELKDMLDLAKAEIGRLQQLLRRQKKQPEALLQNAVPQHQRAKAIEEDIVGCLVQESVDGNNVDGPLQQGVGEEDLLENNYAEIKLPRDELCNTEYREQFFCTQSAARAFILQSSQQECDAWEGKFAKTTCKMYTHCNSADNYRALLQKLHDQVTLLSPRLVMYFKKLCVIHEMIIAELAQRGDEFTSQHDLAALVNEKQLCLMALKMIGSRSLECDILASKHADKTICRHSCCGTDNNNDNCSVPEHDVLLTNATEVMNEVEELRKTNGALTLELQLAHKKLTMRNTRIESLKLGFRKEASKRKELQIKINEERAGFKEELQRAKSDALHWRKCYEDLLNNCHTIKSADFVWRSRVRQETTPALETAFLFSQKRSPIGSPVDDSGGDILSTTRCVGEHELRGIDDSDCAPGGLR